MDAKLEERLRFATQLPTLSGIALQIIDLARDPELDMGRLASVLSRDPALTTKVLRVANSPLYGQRRRTSNLRQALMVLGLNATVTLALSFSLSACLQDKGSKRLDLDAIWRRALLSALAARLLGEHMGLHSSEELFLAGLLQDVGIFALEAADPERYPAAVSGQASHDTLVQAERDAFGTDHSEAGAWLMRHWGLPEYLPLATMESHELRTASLPQDLVPFMACVAVSGPVADVYLTEDTEAATACAAGAAEAWLDLDQEALGDVLDRLRESLPEIESLFETQIVSSRDAAAMTDQARELLAARNLQLLQRVSEERQQTQELRRLSQRLQETARRDALTGLYNRGHFDQCLEQDYQEATEQGWPLTLAFLDFDDFKAVNDRYGHQGGDTILRNVTAEMVRQLRADDLLARYGGEEFTLLLRGTGLDEAWAVVERLRAAVEGMTHELDDGQQAQVTISAGIVSHMDGGHRVESAETLVRQADRALYLAKHLGRNRIEAAE